MLHINSGGVLDYKICELFLTSNLLSHRGIPNYDFKVGRITFLRNSRPQPKKIVDDVRNMNDFSMFNFFE